MHHYDIMLLYIGAEVNHLTTKANIFRKIFTLTDLKLLLFLSIIIYNMLNMFINN